MTAERFGHANELLAGEAVKHRLDAQEASPAPQISSNYIYAFSNFYDNLRGIEPLTDVFFKAFPKEFRTDVSDKNDPKYPKKIATGYSTFAVINTNNLNLTNDEYSDFLTDLNKEANDRFSLAIAGFVHNGNSYMACYCNKIEKNEKGIWEQKDHPTAGLEFLALALAKGIIETSALHNIGLHHSPYWNKIISITEELKNKGVKPAVDANGKQILPYPLHGKKAEENQAFNEVVNGFVDKIIAGTLTEDSLIQKGMDKTDLYPDIIKNLGEKRAKIESDKAKQQEKSKKAENHNNKLYGDNPYKVSDNVPLNKDEKKWPDPATVIKTQLSRSRINMITRIRNVLSDISNELIR